MYYTTQVPKVVSREFDDEIILANFETGTYYSLAQAAADIWLGLRSGASVDEIARGFAPPDPEELEGRTRLVTDFVNTLLAEGLISPCQTPADPQSWSPRFSPSFVAPVLDRYDDLRDLLFLDPVHDVSEAGWPAQVKDVG